MSPPSTPTTVVGSIASIVAERRSSSNIASSPKMSPGPKVASVIVRPSPWLRIARALTVAHDVTGVAVVALAEHELPRVELARHRHLRDPLEVARLERFEGGHPPQQLDDLIGAHIPHLAKGIPHRATGPPQELPRGARPHRRPQ